MIPATLLSVVGARPQFIKLAPVCRAIFSVMPEAKHRILHTGQHYDYGMSDIFFKELDIPPPDAYLGIGSGSHGAQTGAMLGAIEQHVLEARPDGVIAFGDTNSTLAASLAASKLHIPLFHVEAGLRSFDRRMPEEINRIIADHCSDQLFAPTEEAMRNLRKEGLSDRAVKVGDVMYDAVLHNAERAKGAGRAITECKLTGREFGVVTVHRASNTSPDALSDLMRILGEVSEIIPLIFPMHPRTRVALEHTCESLPNLYIVDPQSYLDMLSLVQESKLVLTDSGGLQKEAVFLGTPCITLRESTEWVETVSIGANTVVGLCKHKIFQAVKTILREGPTDWSKEIEPLYGDGKASEKIARSIRAWM